VPVPQPIVFTRIALNQLHVEQLPDGSVAIYDERTQSVHSLNSSAAVVWEACAKGATVEQVRAALSRHFGLPVDQDHAWTAIQRLQEAELVTSDAPLAAPPVAEMARRSALKTIGAVGGIALPLVLTLTASQQRAYAATAVSGTTTPAPTTTLFFIPPLTTTSIFIPIIPIP